MLKQIHPVFYRVTKFLGFKQKKLLLQDYIDRSTKSNKSNKSIKSIQSGYYYIKFMEFQYYLNLATIYLL